MNKMYQISLPIDTNDPPNNPEASLITSQSNGMAITNMINANKMKKSDCYLNESFKAAELFCRFREVCP